MKFRVSILLLSLLVIAVPAIAVGQTGGDSDAVAAITKLENDAIKADLANDRSFYENNLADDWTAGTSFGEWETKASMLKDMADTKNNKTNSESLSDLKVRVYGDTAIATFTEKYDSLVRGQHRARTVIVTDTWVKQNGAWKQVASHASQMKQGK